MTLAPRDGHDWTVEDYRQLDDDERFEVLRGELKMVPAPMTSHQRIVTELGAIINNHVRSNDLGICFHAPFDVVLDDDTVVQPDFIFVSEQRRDEVLDERGANGAPDLVVEVLSPGTAGRDRGIKRTLYAEAGVPWMLIVDPEELIVEIFELNESRYVWAGTAVGAATLQFELFDDLSINLTEVWPEEKLEKFEGADTGEVAD